VSAPIALITDFGTRDPYVGIVKGVILQRAEVTWVDITHAIPPGDIRRAAFVLWQSYRHFPPGTIFLAVVDPSVGSPRLPVIAEGGRYRFIAPDNGLLTYVWKEHADSLRAWALANPAFQLPLPSTTFHGRDIFAPAAAYAAHGVPGRAFGPMVPALRQIPLPSLRLGKEVLQGEALHADHFGNILTSLGVFHYDGKEWVLTPWLRRGEPRFFTPGAVRLPDGRLLPIVRTFSETPAGEVAALVGSSGLIELVSNRTSAAEILALPEGSPLTLLSRKAYQALQPNKERP